MRKKINRLLIGLILLLTATFHLVTNAYIGHVLYDTKYYFWNYLINIFFFYELTIFILYGLELILLIIIE